MVRFEHYALNLAAPHAIANWYVETLGCRLVFKLDSEPFTVFLGDSQGRVFWEIYRNPRAPFSDVRDVDPAIYHLAFAVEDVDAVKAKVVAAGGSFIEEIRSDSGSYLVMLRDPWGIALQLCRRVPPFLSPPAAEATAEGHG
jgi:glyoxylase I family protein